METKCYLANGGDTETMESGSLELKEGRGGREGGGDQIH